jgi:hypothetical protein
MTELAKIFLKLNRLIGDLAELCGPEHVAKIEEIQAVLDEFQKLALPVSGDCDLMKTNRRLEANLAQAEAREARYRKALEFYAAPWGPHHGNDEQTNLIIMETLNRAGQKAREALAPTAEAQGQDQGEDKA